MEFLFQIYSFVTERNMHGSIRLRLWDKLITVCESIRHITTVGFHWINYINTNFILTITVVYGMITNNSFINNGNTLNFFDSPLIRNDFFLK